MHSLEANWGLKTHWLLKEISRKNRPPSSSKSARLTVLRLTMYFLRFATLYGHVLQPLLNYFGNPCTCWNSFMFATFIDFTAQHDIYCYKSTIAPRPTCGIYVLVSCTHILQHRFTFVSSCIARSILESCATRKGSNTAGCPVSIPCISRIRDGENACLQSSWFRPRTSFSRSISNFTSSCTQPRAPGSFADRKSWCHLCSFFVSFLQSAFCHDGQSSESWRHFAPPTHVCWKTMVEFVLGC